jgi:hypothetical protein
MRHTRPYQLLALSLVAAMITLQGCNIVAPVYYLVHGPEKIKKVHALDKNKSTVIFIDDRSNHVPRRSLRIMIGEEAEKTLLKQRTVKDMISTQSAMAAAGTDRFGKPLSNTEIGEAVKAQILIYATIDSFGLSTDGTTLAPIVDMRVRVIDVAADQRVWPDDAAGYRLIARLPASTKSMPTSTSARYQVEDELARYAGMELAQLFYNHEANKGVKVPD